MEALDPEKSQEFTKEQIRLAAAGDQDALSQLYQQTYHRVYVTVKALIKDEDAVLDIVQDSYVKAFGSLDQLDKAENFCAWMKRIATNKAKDYFKKKKPVLFSEMVTEDGEELDFEDDRFENLPDAVIDRKETTRLIDEILGTLSEEQRIAIGMFYYEQMSVAEIAEALGCSQNTVKSRLSYGRKKVETKVRDLEKQGTKLYSLAPLPFLVWLFRMDADAAMLPGEVAQAEQIWLAVKASAAESATAGTSAAATSSTANFAAETSAAANSAAASAANSAAAAAGKTAVGAGLKAAGGKLLAGKIIAGVLAVTVVAGGITAAVKSGSSGKHDTAAVETTAAVTEAQPMSEKQLHDMFDSVLQEYQEGMAQQNFQVDSWVHTGRNAEYAMEKYHQEPGHNFYYTFYDLNRDGQGELLTGYDTGERIVPVGVYSSVNGKIYPVLSTPEFGTYGVTLQILDDGSLYHLMQYDGVIKVQIISRMTEDCTTSRAIAQYNAQAENEADQHPGNKELVDELLSRHKPVEDLDWKLIAAPEQQTNPPAEAEDMVVYDPVKNEYRKAMCATESTYAQFDYQYLHPESSALYYYFLSAPDFNFYTADYDINHDGTRELLIGFGTDSDIQVVDVYGYDGTQPVSLLFQNALGSGSARLQIMTDGTMYYSEVLDAQSSVHSLYKMAEDGRSAKESATCLYTAGDDDGELKAIQEQVSACTPVTDFSWTMLTADQNQFAPGDADLAIVESKKIVAAYWEVYQMPHDEFNNDPTLYERYPYLDGMMWNYHMNPANFAGQQFYYAIEDIDGDGIPELLIGHGKRGDIQPCNSFAWNGQEMERLGTEGKCEILADGTVLDYVGNGGEIAGVYKLENSRLVENSGTEFPRGMYYDYNDYLDAVDAHGGFYQPEWSTVSGHHD